MTLTLFQGVTFRVERGDMVIARILHGSSIDRQGMLHTGDIIREVNGREVGTNPHELQELLRDCSGSIILKVLPSYRETLALPQVSKKKAAFSISCLDFLPWESNNFDAFENRCINTHEYNKCLWVIADALRLLRSYTVLYLIRIGYGSLT